MNNISQQTSNLLQQSSLHMACLKAAYSLSLPDWSIGAGFLRNLIWDHLHQKRQITPLNDVDLVYFDSADISVTRELEAVRELGELCPQVNWEVKNQARMHHRHGHQPYNNTTDAISRWVEVPTCVGVRLMADQSFNFTAPFGLEENWSLVVRVNPYYPNPGLFRQRVVEKKWQQIWPALCCNFP